MGEEGGWSPRFSRPFNDWEVEEVERLVVTIQRRRLIPNLEDRVLFSFQRASFGALVFLLKWVFFAWEASWGKMLTLDQLKKRGWTLANRCFLCCVEEESIDCTKARVLWELLFALFGVMWVLPYSVRDTFLGWHSTFMGKKCSKVWMAAPLCLFWAVWKERNRIAFENEELSIHRMKNSFVCNFWSWTKSVIDEGPLPLINFFDWLKDEG